MSTRPANPKGDERLQRRAFLLATVAMLAACAWFVLRPLLAPMVLAVLTTVIIFPVQRRFESWFSGRRVWAAIVSTLALALGVGAPLFGFSILFWQQVQEFLAEILGRDENRTRLAELTTQLVEWSSSLAQSTLGHRIDLVALAQDTLRKLAGAASERIPSLFGQAGQLAIGALLFFILLFVLLIRGRALVELLIELSPFDEDHSQRIVARIEGTIKGVFLGVLATAVAQGTLGGLGFWLAGFDNQLLWGVLIAGAGMIPMVGTGLLFIPSVLYLFASGRTGEALWMAAIGATVGTIDNLIKPLVIHERAAVHPVLVFVGLLGGLRSFGPMGLLYGPLLVAGLIEMIRIYRDEYSPHRHLRAETPGAGGSKGVFGQATASGADGAQSVSEMQPRRKRQETEPGG